MTSQNRTPYVGRKAFHNHVSAGVDMRNLSRLLKSFSQGTLPDLVICPFCSLSKPLAITLYVHLTRSPQPNATLYRVPAASQPSITQAIVLLTPVGTPAKVRPSTAVIAPGAAQARIAPHVDNGPASVACLGDARRSRGLWRRGHAVALAEAGLAAVAAVEGLVLNVVLGPAVAGVAAAAVEVAAGTGAGAGDVVGGDAADVNVGDGGGVGWRGGVGGRGGGGGLFGGGCGGLESALGAGLRGRLRSAPGACLGSGLDRG